MFNRNKVNQNNYYENIQLNRIYYEIEEMNRRIRNLNNRLRRIEGYLGLSNETQNEN